MSTEIPYDPSLALGNIVPDEKLKVLEAISALQTPIDAAQGELNSAIMLKRKLQMTMNDLVNMGIDTSELNDSIAKVGGEILDAAKKYAKVSVDALPKVAAQKAKIAQVSDSLESPIDYNRSQIKLEPLSSDSIHMDSQYFSFAETGQSSESSMAALKSFVSASTSFLGDKYSAQASASAQSQVSHQREHHDIEGTLVITANCTHKQASVFAPFYIDVDKGIRVWNRLFPDDMIKTNSGASMAAIAAKQETKDEKSFNLISGATYGSCFIGMVHVLKQSGTESSQQMYSAAAGLQAQMEVGSWFGSYEGGFGVSSSFSNSAKSLLSQQSISSHVSLVTVGVIPCIKANNVDVVVKQFANFSPDAMMGELQTMQNATAGEQQTVTSEASDNKTRGQIAAMKATTIKSCVSAVQDGDKESNKMLDVNSLMTAFEDYVQKAIAGQAGVPITYFLKPITAAQLAQMWVAKYLPGEYVTSAGDDSAPKEPGDDKK
ncbi:hypothetical protein [Candidatus Uabimicrobium amorphum]|uniref:Uncharacterized protein n=1 Tax=Uabimicrobium amorphum TaxID=2596890 RepID=A0A5S9F4Q9_UABAM|nr:hypothetical protein [Candidatus Uabimicrobium amorphum]BBM84492.1 hypothetical protein UABAM_02853 [Candidatus Uabimicrobium amorphum]